MAVSDFEGPDGHLLCDVWRSAIRVSYSRFWEDQCITARTFGRPITINPKVRKHDLIPESAELTLLTPNPTTGISYPVTIFWVDTRDERAMVTVLYR